MKDIIFDLSNWAYQKFLIFKNGKVFNIDKDNKKEVFVGLEDDYDIEYLKSTCEVVDEIIWR